MSFNPAQGAEGSVYGGPVGGTDIRNAYVSPVPGFVVGFANVPGFITNINGNNGGESRTLRRVNVGYDIQAVAVAYTYPFKLFDGILSSALQGSYQPYVRFSVNDRTERISGWGDLYSDILGWTKYLGSTSAPRPGAAALPYGLTLKVDYSMIFPVGAYNTHQFDTPGHNDYFIIPNVTATYLSKPNFLGDGVEYDLHAFYDRALTNPTTNYASGDIIDLDYAISERSGRWQYGIAGFGAFQVNRDVQSGQTVPIKGNYFTEIQIGPVVAYDFPKLGLGLKLKVQLPVYDRNTILRRLRRIRSGVRPLNTSLTQ